VSTLDGSDQGNGEGAATDGGWVGDCLIGIDPQTGTKVAILRENTAAACARAVELLGDDVHITTPDDVARLIHQLKKLWPSAQISSGQSLIDELNATHTRGAVPETEFSKTTISMHIYDSVAVFEKGIYGRKYAPKTGGIPQ